MASKRKTGEPQRSKQPLSIDLLPGEMHDRIQKERSRSGKSFMRIEQESSTWTEWSKVDEKVQALFPGRRLPHSNLQRWWDLRKEQVREQVLAETERARVFAETFASRELKDGDEAAMNAIRDLAFSVMQTASSGDQVKLLGALMEYGHLMVKFKRIELGKQKMQIERERLDLVAIKIKGLKSDVDRKKLSPKELKAKLDEIYGLTA